MKQSMLRDSRGVDFLGMRMVVILAVSALVMAFAFAGLEYFMGRQSHDRTMREVQSFTEMARLEYVTGCPGDAGREKAIEVPGGATVVFGGVPGPDGPEREPCACYVKFDDGHSETIITGVDFCRGENNGSVSDMPCVLGSGSYDLTVKTMEASGSPVAAIYGGEW
jgi:hypothetical protein